MPDEDMRVGIGAEPVPDRPVKRLKRLVEAPVPRQPVRLPKLGFDVSDQPVEKGDIDDGAHGQQQQQRQRDPFFHVRSFPAR